MTKPEINNCLWGLGFFALAIASMGTGWQIAYSQTAPKATSQSVSSVTQQSTPTPTNNALQSPLTATAAPNSAPEDFCKKIRESTKRTSDEIIACIQDRTSPYHMECKDQGLCSTSPNVRGAAIGAVYNGMNVLVFDVFAAPGDEEGQKELIKLGSFSAKTNTWDKAGKSFSVSNCNYCAVGNIVGDTLSVSVTNQYQIDEKNKTTGEISRKLNDVRCEISVTLNKDRSAMEGSARCQSIPHVFKARIGFGG